MSAPLLICPEFFSGRMDGIGRVSGAFHAAMERAAGVAPYVLASNDLPGACPPSEGRCFGRNYKGMLLEALLRPGAMAGGPRHGPGPELPIVCTHLGLSPVARLLAARTGRPYVVFIHGVEAWKPLRVRARWGLSGANMLFTNSRYTLGRFQACNPWAVGVASEVVRLGVPVPAVLGSPAVRSAPSDPFLALTVGRMAMDEHYEGYRDASDLYKGFKTFIGAVALLRREGIPAQARLVGDGNARTHLERWVAEQPVAPHVKFLGRVSDQELADEYSRAHVFVLASEGEGFGLVFAEAMAHGLPCIGVSAGATAEVVVNDEAGYIVRPRDCQEMADRLRVLYQNPVIYGRLSRGSVARYQSQFTQQAFEERILEALRAVASFPA